MPRKLNALEIAEGALLADIAVVFQLLVLYLPVGGDFFRLLIFIVFAVLVLRRGLYVGIMGMCVSFFISGVLTGPQYVPFMFLEAAGGLFLGATMKYRLRHVFVVLLGITCGAAALYIVVFVGAFLTGIPLSRLVRSLHNAYTSVIALVTLLTGPIGLEHFWRQTLYPPLNNLVTWGFTYWWGVFYVGLWIVLIPVVITIYAMTNVFVRLLGYEVQPFPGRKFGNRLHRLTRPLLKRMLRRRRLRQRGRHTEQVREEVKV